MRTTFIDYRLQIFAFGYVEQFKESVIRLCVHFTVLWYRHYSLQIQKCKSLGFSSLSLLSGRLSWKIGEPFGKWKGKQIFRYHKSAFYPWQV